MFTVTNVTITHGKLNIFFLCVVMMYESDHLWSGPDIAPHFGLCFGVIS